ncbi:MAG: STAS domain-containing protein [Gammaproteobacteria bacterium]|nr:STAS domain-containing protein [Gammaproteobacteria bacterium]
MPKQVVEPKIHVSGEQLAIAGLLQLPNAMTIIAAAVAAAEKNSIRVVDFSAVEDGDSTGILLMLRLQRLLGKKIIFKNVPARLQALLSLSNLTNQIQLA